MPVKARYGAVAFNVFPRGHNMEKLIELFCHVSRITDPLSIQIAVSMVGGGIPLLFLYALFILLGELASKQREATTPVSHRPARRKGRAAPRSAPVSK